MGCPSIYYSKALQLFARALHLQVKDFSEVDIADKYLKENNEEKLVEAINSYKEQVTEKRYFFIAGEVSEYVIRDADENDGCDGFNACLGGLNMFEQFVFRDKYEEDDK